MAKKTKDWKSRILEAGEQRYIREVIRPALAEVKTARAELKARMPKGKNADADKVALFKAEMERMNTFESRIQAHLKDTQGRFSKRTV